MGTNWRSLCGIFILVPLLLDLHLRHIAGWPVCGHLMFTKVEIKYLECWFFLWVLNRTKWSAVARSCPTLCDSIDCSLPGSSVHGIFQAIVLEWIAISFSGDPNPGLEPGSPTVGRCFTVWATNWRGHQNDTHTQKESPWENRGRDWINVVTSQGMPGATRN